MSLNRMDEIEKGLYYINLLRRRKLRRKKCVKKDVNEDFYIVPYFLSNAQFTYPDDNMMEELERIANYLVSGNKGILSVDESSQTLDKRFAVIGVENNEVSRRRFRQLFFTADQSIGNYISGVIVSHETLYQKTDEGVRFIDLLEERNIIPGVRVDSGFVTLMSTVDEKTTQGLDDLLKRCVQYRRDGCQFAKWRCIYKVTSTTPTQLTISTTAKVLARFASICQAAVLVPIIQAEVVNEGNHNIERGKIIIEAVLKNLFTALFDYHVHIEGCLLKTNMVCNGMDGPKASIESVGKLSLEAYTRTVPAAVPGILVLSGGFEADDASLKLNAINKAKGRKPWPVTFCFSQALQVPVLKIWEGLDENVENAQSELLIRVQENWLATQGLYVKRSLPCITYSENFYTCE